MNKFAIILLSTIIQTAVIVTAHNDIMADVVESGAIKKKQTNHLRKTKTIVQQAVTGGGSTSIENEDDYQHTSSNDDEVSSSSINHRILRKGSNYGWNRGTYEVAAGKRQSIKICAPNSASKDDTLFLFLSGSGGHLPIEIEHWTRGAECFKSNNKQKDCFRATHCVVRDGNFCTRFRNGRMVGKGNDLATVMYYHKMTQSNPGCWTVDLNGGTTWAMVTAITEVRNEDPIREISGESCDEVSDSAFPSVFGTEHDVLLLSQSFDDAASMSDFRAPSGTSTLGYLRVNQDAGFLYGEELDHTGHTGVSRTGGRGGPSCKDALLSVVVNRDERV